jgi:formate hydrogenlyase subunit 3/multisubunit Na+/H+ antiporter MnhD subunit
LIFLVVIMVSSLLDVIYFFPVVKTAFFDSPAGAAEADGGKFRNLEMERPVYLFMVVPLALTALFSVIFFFFPGTFHLLDLAEIAVRNLF